MIINIKNLTLNFANQKVFDNINILINGQEKIGLVGLNGSGKSTLLKAIAGQQICDSGSITTNKKIGYMSQDVVLQSDKNVVEEAISSIAEDDLFELERLKAEAKKMLSGLGFSQEQMEMPVSSLSVGWKMRIVLAKLLLEKADFYLFDEPTNHLDIITKEWFFEFLQRADFGFLLVCHEKYFLDHLCDKIFELEMAKGTLYTGNYSSYIEQKEAYKEKIYQAYENQQKEFKRKQAIVDKFRASATKAAFAKSLQKSLDKEEKIVLPPEIKSVNFSLPEIQQSGQIVATINNISKAFDDHKIFQNISFEVLRNEKIAIVAANGVGKTTLLNIIMGKLKQETGSIDFGHNVTTTFFEQDQVKALNPEKTILQTIHDRCPRSTEQEVRSMLGCFLFTKDLVNKKTKVLSGGERNRVSMVAVLLQNANFLLLDEPTNHLDIPSKEILLRALKKYKGTILFVSHDQDFINQLATHIIELTPARAYKYPGNYEDFLSNRSFIEQADKTEKTKCTNNNSSNKAIFEQKKDLKRLEDQIKRTEKEIELISLKLADFDWGTKEFKEIEQKIKVAQDKLDVLFKELEKFLD